MIYNYTIAPFKFETIEEMPEAWNDYDYRQLLEIMEYGNASDLSLHARLHVNQTAFR